jgi:hypothetical protein
VSAASRTMLAPKPRRQHTFALRISAQEHDQLAALATLLGMSGSEVIRALIEREHAVLVRKELRMRVERKRQRT